MWNTEFLDDDEGCGSGLPHAQHTAWEKEGVTYLCRGRRKSAYIHCGEPANHRQHRTGDDGKGPYCLGVLTAEERAKHEKRPVIYFTTHELVGMLEGRSFTVADSDGNTFTVARHVPNTLLEAHRKACANAGQEPTMTWDQAVQLTKGIV